MMPPTIAEYYRWAFARLEEEVESTPDDRVIGMIPEEWIDYLSKKHGMDEIIIDDSRVTAWWRSYLSAAFSRPHGRAARNGKPPRTL